MIQERFIPYSKQDVVEICQSQLPTDVSVESFQQLCELLGSYIHFQYHEVVESLKQDYAPFDPSNDLRQLHQINPQQRALQQQAFADNFAKVLDAANYEKITEQDLQDALHEESLFKVRLAVEFDDFEQVVFYRRGESQKTETLSSLFGLRKQTIHFTNYQRVAIFLTLKDKAHFQQKRQQVVGFEPGSTIVKLFQNVPKADLEMLFPNSEVRMRKIDKVIIGASAVVGGSVVLVTKLGASLLLLAGLFAFWLGLSDKNVEMTQQHMLSFALGVGVFGGFIFKEWSKFKSRKIKFMKALADNLYFKNLDNNAGVFHTLVDAAEDEDFKEAILAYSFLLNEQHGLCSQALDSKIERYFDSQYQCQFDFEVSDALAKLERFSLVNCQDGIYRAIPLAQAKQQLDQQWDEIFNFNR
ncbi:TMEM143 family protein [Colwellia sp. MEBiC06753]